MLVRPLGSVTFALVSACLLAGCSASNQSDDRDWICEESDDDCRSRADIGGPDTRPDATTRDTRGPDVHESDTTHGPDTSSPDASDDELVRRGRIDLVQDRTDSIQNRSSVSAFAQFQVVDPAESSRAPCRHFDSEHCDLKVCDTNGRTSSPGIEQVSAGNISITGGQQNIELLPGEEDAYSESFDSPIWDGQQTLTIEAAGDIVAPFSTNLTPAADTTVTKPDFPGSFQSLEISTSSDLEIVWEHDGPSRRAFLARLSALADDNRAFEMHCEWPLQQTRATIPNRLLSKFPADTNASYEFGAGARETLPAGDFEVTARALDVAADDDSQTVAGKGAARLVE